MQAAFARYGYGIPTHGKYDGETMEVITAFQRHFRPERVDGIADQSTMATLYALLDSLPRLQHEIARCESRLKGEGRVFLRYSGTEPLLRIMVEGPSKPLVTSMAKSLAA